MGHQHGQLRKWRRILSLQLLGGEGCRSDRASGHLRTGMPTYGGSFAIWRIFVAEEDEGNEDDEDVVSEMSAMRYWTALRAFVNINIEGD